MTTTHTRDALGNEISRALPDGLTQTFTYNALGQLTATNGVMQYPVSYSYDDRGGRLRTMTMGTGGETVWNYSDSGWLTSKEDDAGKGATYTYTAGGKLKTRTWERGAHTRYDHDPAGRLVWRRYFTSAGSDTGSNAGNDPLTGDVSLIWNRFSQLQQATASAGTGRPAIVTTRQYDPNLKNRIAAEQTDIAGILARTIRYGYDGWTGNVTGYAIRETLTPGSTLVRQVGYTRDSAGRLKTVTGDNFGGADRAGWACQQMEDADFTAPFDPGTGGLAPAGAGTGGYGPGRGAGNAGRGSDQ